MVVWAVGGLGGGCKFDLDGPTCFSLTCKYAGHIRRMFSALTTDRSQDCISVYECLSTDMLPLATHQPSTPAP